MSRRERLVQTILRGRSDANIRFNELRTLMRHLGFEERVRGSHHILTGKASKNSSICKAVVDMPNPTR